jgi:hypothetical protein
MDVRAVDLFVVDHSFVYNFVLDTFNVDLSFGHEHFLFRIAA